MAESSQETAILRGPTFTDTAGRLLFTLDASYSQAHEFAAEVTDHPVEDGIDQRLIAALRESLGLATGAESLPMAAQGVAAQGKGLQWHISLSHDGPIASAVVTLGLA